MTLQKELLEKIRKVVAEHPEEYEQIRRDDDPDKGHSMAWWVLGKLEPTGTSQTNYRVQWDIDPEDVTVKLGLPAHKEQVFDGEDGERRALEHIGILREAEERGMCSNIVVERRVVLVTIGDWEEAEHV